MANGTVPNGPICEFSDCNKLCKSRGRPGEECARGWTRHGPYSDLPVRLAIVVETGREQGRDMPGSWLIASCTGRYTTYMCTRYEDTRFHARNIISFWKDFVLCLGASLRCGETPCSPFPNLVRVRVRSERRGQTCSDLGTSIRKTRDVYLTRR